jgi:hypothetical protein
MEDHKECEEFASGASRKRNTEPRNRNIRGGGGWRMVKAGESSQYNSSLARLSRPPPKWRKTRENDEDGNRDNNPYTLPAVPEDNVIAIP